MSTSKSKNANNPIINHTYLTVVVAYIGEKKTLTVPQSAKLPTAHWVNDRLNKTAQWARAEHKAKTPMNKEYFAQYTTINYP